MERKQPRNKQGQFLSFSEIPTKRKRDCVRRERRHLSPSAALSLGAPISPYRFSIFAVNSKQRMDLFVRHSISPFNYEIGRAFYEFIKPEDVQSDKEIVFQHRATGTLYSGVQTKKALGLGSSDIRINPKNLPSLLLTYAVFIQSHSLNRVLIPGTRILYDRW